MYADPSMYPRNPTLPVKYGLRPTRPSNDTTNPASAPAPNPSDKTKLGEPANVPFPRPVIINDEGEPVIR